MTTEVLKELKRVSKRETTFVTLTLIGEVSKTLRNISPQYRPSHRGKSVEGIEGIALSME